MEKRIPDDKSWNFAALDVPQKTRFQPDLTLLALEGNLVVDSVTARYDGHRGGIFRVAC